MPPQGGRVGGRGRHATTGGQGFPLPPSESSSAANPPFIDIQQSRMQIPIFDPCVSISRISAIVDYFISIAGAFLVFDKYTRETT